MDEICIIGGHYDSFTWENPLQYAPGADDNASGIAAILEIARVMKMRNYESECTIKFITFAAEELMRFGNSGAEHYAQESVDMDFLQFILKNMISVPFGICGKIS